jgi:hypothetical protein
MFQDAIDALINRWGPTIINKGYTKEYLDAARKDVLEIRDERATGRKCRKNTDPYLLERFEEYLSAVQTRFVFSIR